MSAFVVGTDHIDYLVSAAVAAERGTYGLGVALLTEADVATVRAAGGDEGLQPYNYGRSERTHLWQGGRTPDALGRLLLAENIFSVATRYPNDTPDELPGPTPTPVAGDYTFTRVPAVQLHAAQIIRAIECWQYQTCEYVGHDDAPGWQMTERLYKAAVSDLVGDRRDLAWEWSRPHTA